jgi:hypothetical protein
LGMAIFLEVPGGVGPKLTVTTIIWAWSVAAVFACDCEAPPVREARTTADVVFRGTIVALKPSNAAPGLWGSGHQTPRTAVFRVTRVWTGEIGPTIEMPAYEEEAACWGFWPRLLRAGNELLVYATRWPGGSSGSVLYMTNICSRTELAEGNKDLDELGAGYEPGQSPESKRRRTFLISAAAIVALGTLLSYLLQRRFSARAGRFATVIR